MRIKNDKLLVTVLLFISLFLLSVGLTYTVYFSSKASNINTIKSGNITFSYVEPANEYIIENALPIYDDYGKKSLNYFEFIINSNATIGNNDDRIIKIPYEILLEPLTIDNNKKSLFNSQIKVYLTKVVGDNEIEVLPPIKISELDDVSNCKQIYMIENKFDNTTSLKVDTYRLRAWISDDVDSSNWGNDVYQYKFRINIHAFDSVSD